METVKAFGRDVYVRAAYDKSVITEMEMDVYRVKRFAHKVSTETSVIVDLGANIGAFSLLARSIAPRARIIAFEPDRENFEALVANAVGADLECVNAAVMGRSGTVVMEPSCNSACKAHYLIEPIQGTFDIHPWMLDARYVRLMSSIPSGWSSAPCMTLTEVFREFSLEKIDILKMDIESSEWGVFHETPRELIEKIKYMAIEIHANTDAIVGEMIAKLMHTHHVETLGPPNTAAYVWAQRYNWA